VNVVVGDATISYRVDGRSDAPPVLLLNSLGTDLSMWDQQASRLSERYRVVRFDARGHGATSATPAPYTIDLLAGDALAVLDDTGFERAHVVGISLGGMVAIWVAGRHRERVHRLVLASTAPRIGTAESWQARADAVRRGGTAAVAAAVMDRLFSARFRAAHSDVVARFAASLTGFSAEGYVGACLALRDADLASEVRAIVAPTLVLAGTEDVSTPVADLERLHEEVAGSRLLVLDGAGHLSSVERPEAFSAAVERFLDGEEVGRA
jgi:3-oxoadipate enol-lactonase